MSRPRRGKQISRRGFIEGTGAAIVAAAVPALPAQTNGNGSDIPRSSIRLTINGKAQTIEVEDRWTLAEALRDHLHLTGTKIGCDRGECGACTVLLEGKPIYSCSHLAAWMDGRSVQTVEGLEHNGKLDPLQQSFMDHDAPQCGYCTAGRVRGANPCLSHPPRATRDEGRAARPDNICRFSNYNRYVEAT